MRSYISMLANGEVLDEVEAENAFNIIMSGDATPAQIGAFLMALRVRGESISEITGAAGALRAKAMFIEAPENAMDIVGTGGDATGNYNISKGAALSMSGLKPSKVRSSLSILRITSCETMLLGVYFAMH